MKEERPRLHHPQPKNIASGTPPSIIQNSVNRDLTKVSKDADADTNDTEPKDKRDSNLKQSPSVSFSNNEQERLRRFTISAHPSSVTLSDADYKKPQISGINTSVEPFVGPFLAGPHLLSSQYQAGLQTSPLVQTPIHHQQARLVSSLSSSRNNSAVGTDFFLFLTKSSHVAPQASPHSSRVTSPVTDQASSKFGSPSPDMINSPKFKSAPPGHNSTGFEGALALNLSRNNSLMKTSNKTVVKTPVGPPVPFQQYLTKEDDGKIHVLLGCTGSVATIKVPLIIDKLFQIYGNAKISIQLVVTKSAGHFLKGLKINNNVKIWRDEDEWANFNERIDYFHQTSTAPKTKKNPFDKLILHNELRKWADIMLIAPLSANTMAKIANGLSDNLLTSIVRSWNWSAPAISTVGSSHTVPNQSVPSKKPILIAPAMNTFMYTHPLTAKQLELLSSVEYGFGMEILKPVEKVLICGDIGMGGMREWSDIVDILKRRIGSIKQLEDESEDDDDEDGNDEDESDYEDEDEDDDEDDKDENENDKNKNNEVDEINDNKRLEEID